MDESEAIVFGQRMTDPRLNSGQSAHKFSKSQICGIKTSLSPQIHEKA
jgi:hypothetical protein